MALLGSLSSCDVSTVTVWLQSHGSSAACYDGGVKGQTMSDLTQHQLIKTLSHLSHSAPSNRCNEVGIAVVPIMAESAK